MLFLLFSYEAFISGEVYEDKERERDRERERRDEEI